MMRRVATRDEQSRRMKHEERLRENGNISELEFNGDWSGVSIFDRMVYLWSAWSGHFSNYCDGSDGCYQI